MNKFYFSFFTITIIFYSFCGKVSAQTTLAAGDIAFTGYHATPNSPDSDRVSFVLLTNVTAGTVIRFTENAWGNNLAFRTGENTVSLTINPALTAGNEITISGVPGGTPVARVYKTGLSAGSISGLMLSLSLNGDQVIAYQSAVEAVAPFTFISAIHMNVYVQPGDVSTTDATNWDNLASGTQTSNSSFKPTGLTTGTNCIWIGTQGSNPSERNNGRFSCTLATSGGANLTTAAGVRAACNNPAFWDAEFAASGAGPTWPLPSGCNFLGIIPVQLSSFAGKLNIDKTVDLNWTVEEQSGINKYIVEKSLDAINYFRLGEVRASNNTYDNYSFKDISAGSGLNFYRLFITEFSGKTSYSSIVKISSKGLGGIVFYPNPVTNKLTIEQTVNTLSSKTATILNSIGHKLQSIVLSKKQETIDMQAFSPGVYFLKLEDGTVFRILKQ